MAAPTTDRPLVPSTAEGTALASGRARRRLPTSLVIVALALGGFGIGTTEFVSMGLLPNIASDVGVSIPTAGYLISAYALGVVVGAPAIAVFAARVPRRRLLIVLMAAFVVGNSLTAMAPNFGLLLAARFVAGLPHGAYFGVASLVASSLVGPSKRARAVGGVMLGLSVAQVAGVPIATVLGQQLGWRSGYLTVVVIGVITIVGLIVVVPEVPVPHTASPRRELAAFRHKPVIVTLLIGTVGFGGVFAIYSYITPIMTHVAGMSEAQVPIVLALFGAGGVFAYSFGARFVDRSVVGSMFFCLIGAIVLFALFPMAAHNPITATIVMVLIGVIGTTFVLALQTRLMEVGGEAESIGASMNHASLNLANAIGAWTGGLAISLGWGWTSPALVAVVLGLAGLAIMIIGMRLQPVQRARAVAQARREPAPC
jgi:DHA1 family inner membrane transport protein